MSSGGFVPFYQGDGSVKWLSRDDGDSVSYLAVEDVAPVLESNQAMANTNNGWSGDKTFRRAASIPASIRLKWLTEEGWDCLSTDPGCVKKLYQKLDSSDYAHLRTAEWRLGILKGQGA